MEKTKRVDTIDNLPHARVRSVGNWTEQFSSNGRRYFYNRTTEVSQWDKPAAWVEAEMTTDPEMNEEDLFSYLSHSDRCGSSPEKIDVSEDENSPMAEEEMVVDEVEEEMSEAEKVQRALEAEKVAQEEKERVEKEREYNRYYGYRRYMDEEAMDRKYKMLFGVERTVGPYSKDNYPIHLQRRVDDYNFQIAYDEKMLEARRARREAEINLFNAGFYARKSKTLNDIREQMEERRENFQANFNQCMGDLVAQSKNDDLPGPFSPDMLKRSWSEWPEDKIVACHDSIIRHRSDQYLEKRARFIEQYKPPRPPTPVASPPPAPVILDERKLAELEVRSPSYQEEESEMVVSPVYEDEYDPTARAVHSYSTHGSSGSSSPDQSNLLIGTEPFKTQAYTRPTSERPLEFILEPPPALPILDLAAIEAAAKRKKRHESGRDSGSPPHSPAVHSPDYSPHYSPHSPVLSVHSPVRSPPPPQSSAHSPSYTVRSPVHSPVRSPSSPPRTDAKSPHSSPMRSSPTYQPRSPAPLLSNPKTPEYEPLTSPVHTPIRTPAKPSTPVGPPSTSRTPVHSSVSTSVPPPPPSTSLASSCTPVTPTSASHTFPSSVSAVHTPVSSASLNPLYLAAHPPKHAPVTPPISNQTSTTPNSCTPPVIAHNMPPFAVAPVRSLNAPPGPPPFPPPSSAPHTPVSAQNPSSSLSFPLSVHPPALPNLHTPTKSFTTIPPNFPPPIPPPARTPIHSSNAPSTHNSITPPVNVQNPIRPSIPSAPINNPITPPVNPIISSMPTGIPPVPPPSTPRTPIHSSNPASAHNSITPPVTSQNPIRSSVPASLPQPMPPPSPFSAPPPISSNLHAQIRAPVPPPPGRQIPPPMPPHMRNPMHHPMPPHMHPNMYAPMHHPMHQYHTRPPPPFQPHPLAMDPTMPFFDPTVPPPLPPYLRPPPPAPVLDPPPPAPVLDKLFKECESDDKF